MSACYIAPALAAELAGVATKTLERWQQAGRLPNTRRTPGGHRRYLLSDIRDAMRPL